MTTYLQDVRELQRQFAAEVAQAQYDGSRLMLIVSTTSHDIGIALATLIQLLEDRDSDNKSVEIAIDTIDDAIANLRALVLP